LDLFESSVQVQVLKHGLIWAFSVKRMQRIVIFPLRFEFDIISDDLMLEEHVFVTPVGGGECTIELKRTDQSFNTAKRKRCVKGVNIVDCGVSWDEGLELGSVSHVVFSLKLGWDHVLNGSVSMESQFVWENWWGCSIAILIVIRVARETNFISVVGKSSKLIGNSFKSETSGIFNMIRKIFSEEVPVTIE